MVNLNEFFILENMTQDELELIQEFSNIQKCNKDEIIFLESEQGNKLYLIISGLFKVFKTGVNGRDKTLNLLGKGEFFGMAALFSDGLRTNSVQALTDGELVSIERDKYKEVISNFPDVALKTIGVLSSQLQHANQEIKDLTFKTIEARLKSTLLELGDKFGVKEENCIQIEQQFTHQELADIVGTTRETVTKMLGSMQSDGLIEISNKTIYLNQKLIAEK